MLKRFIQVSLICQMFSTISFGQTMQCNNDAMTIAPATNFPGMNWYEFTIHDDGVVNYLKNAGITSDCYAGVCPYSYDSEFNNISMLMTKKGELYSMLGQQGYYLAVPVGSGIRVEIIKYNGGDKVQSWNWFFEQCK